MFKFKLSVCMLLFPLIFAAVLRAQLRVDFKHRFDGRYQSVYVSDSGTTYLLNAETLSVEIYDAYKQVKALDISGKDTDHHIDNPEAVAVSSDGNIYIADKEKILVYNGEGEYEYMFGPSDDDMMKLNKTSALAFDNFGRLFVADEGKGDIKIYSEQGIFLDTISGLEKPVDLSLDDFGNLYVLEKNAKQISVLDSKFEVVKKLSAAGTRNFSASKPTGIFVEMDGTLYVSDEDKSKVKIFNPNLGGSADVMTYFEFGKKGSGNGEFKKPSGVFVDSQGTIFVVDSEGQNVQAFHIPELSNSKEPSKLVRPSRLPITIKQVTAINDFKARGSGGLLSFVVDANKNIYAVDAKDNEVRIYGFDNKVRTSFGSGGKDEGRFRSPQGIAWSGKKLVYITDTKNNRVQIWSDSGVFQSGFGEKGTTQGEFDNPVDIALDSDGSIYVADSNNDRIQVFTPDGKFERQINKYNGNPLAKPIGVEVGEDGRVYIIQKDKNGIRGVSSDGKDVSAIGGKALIQTPIQTALDRKGSLYVIDPISFVRVFDSEGELITRFGSPGENFGQFQEPSDIDVTEDGEILISDSKNNKITIFTLENFYTAVVAGRINPLVEGAKIELMQSGEIKQETNVLSPDGSFFMREVPPGTYDILISAPGHAKEEFAAKEITAGELIDVGEVKLFAFGSLGGMVSPPSSQAAVSLIDHAGEVANRIQIIDDGSFKFNELRPGNYRLHIEAAGFVEYESDQELSVESGKDSKVEAITLTKLSTVTGIVFPGSSVATVLAKQNGGVADSTTINPYDGSFSLSKLTSGTYEVSIAAEGYHEFLVADVELEVGEVKSLGVIKLTSEKPTSERARLLLAEGKQLHFKLEYKRAQDKLQEALRTDELSKNDEITAYIWLAYSFFPFQDQQEKAKLAIEGALKISPSLELAVVGDFPPDFVALFDQVKPKVSATIEREEPGATEVGGPVSLTSERARILLEEGKKFHFQFQFEQAQQKFREAIETGELSKADQISAYVSLAYACFPVPETKEEVVPTLIKALGLDPALRLDSYGAFSPEFINLLNEAKSKMETETQSNE